MRALLRMFLDNTDNELVDALHLFKFNYRIYRDQLDVKFESGPYQRELLNTIYLNQQGSQQYLDLSLFQEI